MSVYYLKFQFKNKLENFNNVVGCDEKERPSVYNFMIENLKEFKNFDKDIIINIYNYNSKKTYEFFRHNYEVIPKCETKKRDFEWKNIYKNISAQKCIMDNL